MRQRRSLRVRTLARIAAAWRSLARKRAAHRRIVAAAAKPTSAVYRVIWAAWRAYARHTRRSRARSAAVTHARLTRAAERAICAWRTSAAAVAARTRRARQAALWCAAHRDSACAAGLGLPQQALRVVAGSRQYSRAPLRLLGTALGSIASSLLSLHWCHLADRQRPIDACRAGFHWLRCAGTRPRARGRHCADGGASPPISSRGEHAGAHRAYSQSSAARSQDWTVWPLGRAGPAPTCHCSCCRPGTAHRAATAARGCIGGIGFSAAA